MLIDSSDELQQLSGAASWLQRGRTFTVVSRGWKSERLLLAGLPPGQHTYGAVNIIAFAQYYIITSYMLVIK